MMITREPEYFEPSPNTVARTGRWDDLLADIDTPAPPPACSVPPIGINVAFSHSDCKKGALIRRGWGGPLTRTGWERS